MINAWVFLDFWHFYPGNSLQLINARTFFWHQQTTLTRERQRGKHQRARLTVKQAELKCLFIVNMSRRPDSVHWLGSGETSARATEWPRGLFVKPLLSARRSTVIGSIDAAVGFTYYKCFTVTKLSYARSAALNTDLLHFLEMRQHFPVPVVRNHFRRPKLGSWIKTFLPQGESICLAINLSRVNSILCPSTRGANAV